MRAMVLEQIGAPLVERERPEPEIAADEVLVRVLACGVCRTDLHVVDGDLPSPALPVVPGHEVVGEVVAAGDAVRGIVEGDRVGVPWLGDTCGACEFCTSGEENLCRAARFTGYTLDGGYAEMMRAKAAFCLRLPEGLDPVSAAPLLCAGLIGYRAYRTALDQAGRVRRLGLYGFGAAAHLLSTLAVHDGREVYAFTRPGDTETQRFAIERGATWAGGSDERPPESLDAAILFAPVGDLVPGALAAVRPGGAVVCAGIHMSEIPAFPYSLLWEERSVRSVANLTREDGIAYLRAVEGVPLAPATHRYSLLEANRALDDLRHGRFDGAAVLMP